MTNPKIEFLPEHLIDQIKAGEVVERPANVLKEMLENALDAGADAIEIEIIENGMELIRVSDNGHGIASDQIEKAFGRHATSKIKSFQDLYSLSSFGFRGEALPSISSVSHVECVSWTTDQTRGVSLKISGAIVESKQSVEKTSFDHGTVMSVRNLFYNTPARLKFLQSAQSEKNWLKKYLYSFVVSRPDISFSISWDHRDKVIYPKVKTIQERITQLFSLKAKIEILASKREWNGIECESYFIFSQNQRSDGPIEHVLINGRPVLEKSYQRLTQQVLEKINPPSTPDALILLKVPGDIVDVNVHPNKTVVKFFKTNDILSLVSATLSEAITPYLNVTPSIHSSFTLEQSPPSGNSESLKDRTQVYAEHRENFSSTDHLISHEQVAILHHSFGPFFIMKDPDYEHPFYICGKSLLIDWVKDRKITDPYPLLVSHPLRDINIKDEELTILRTKGFEIDKINDLGVIREIPMWATSLPLHLVLSVLMSELRNQKMTSFSFQEIPNLWWIKMYYETQSIDEKKYKILLRPEPFFHE